MNEVIVKLHRNSKGLRLLFDFRHKKSLHNCDDFDICERCRPTLKAIYPRFGGVVCYEKFLKEY